ncbi:MAG TPA: malto-oligosyltrehalose synthase, partial [Polyangiaceae bacterium]|nr:malto-oligosyltrehalose synthase [Polyangiaceae bacterium]
MKKSRPVRSTYRVQLTPGFGFDKTAELAPYLAELGVSHLYASPYLQSAKGSTHGYDVADYSAVNVDLGGLEAHRRMCDALERNGLGQILDIVPNHMSTSPRNAWWWDVLEHGRKSRYASYFDIFWGDAPNAKILVPVLGDRYGKVLAAGELELVRDGQAIVVRYFEHRFPVSPASARALLEAAKVPRLDARFEGELDRVLAEVSGDPEKLDRVLTAQHYRLAFWRLAATDLNYRCFFDINKLIGVKQEDPTVFEASHALALGWLNDGTLDGVRIDHIDGIRDPRTYLERLHERAPRAWVVVEKILESGETLPRDWPIAGTTGYEFLNAVTGLFIDPAGEAPMTDVYQQFAETDARFDEIVYEKKRYILADKFQSEIGRLADLLATCCSADYRFRDTRKDELKAVLHEVIAAFPVYRTYARRDHAGHAELAEQEERFVRQAFAAVAERRPQIDEVLRGFLQEILLCERRGPVETELVLQMQQLTGPVMA